MELCQEENVEEVRHLSGVTVRHGVHGQRLDTEENDGDEGDDNRHDGDDERRPRCFRVLEQHPDNVS